MPIEEQEQLAIGHFGAQRPGPSETLHRRSVSIRGTFPGAPPVALSLLDKEAICSVPSYARTDFANQLWNQGRRLADDRFFGGHHSASEVDILIGGDQIWEVLGVETIKGSGGVIAIDSKFGWLLLGPTKPRRPAVCPATATTAAPTVVISALACAFESPLQLTWPNSAKIFSLASLASTNCEVARLNCDCRLVNSASSCDLAPRSDSTSAGSTN